MRVARLRFGWERCQARCGSDGAKELGGANIPLAYLYRGDYQRFLDGFHLDSQSAYQQFYTGLAHYYLKRFPEAARVFDHAYSLDQSCSILGLARR